MPHCNWAWTHLRLHSCQVAALGVYQDHHGHMGWQDGSWLGATTMTPRSEMGIGYGDGDGDGNICRGGSGDGSGEGDPYDVENGSSPRKWPVAIQPAGDGWSNAEGQGGSTYASMDATGESIGEVQVEDAIHAVDEAYYYR